MILQNCKKNCKKINNQLEVYAMMRSGQHAIIHWLFDQIKEPIYFHNNILCHSNEKVFLDRGVWHNVKSRSPIKTFPWYAYNIEDISIENIDEIKTKYKKALYIVPPKREVKVLIIRDPFNMFASRYRYFYRANTLRREANIKPLRKNQRTNANSDISWFCEKALYRWKEYAREAVGETSFIGKKKIIINYNHWFKSKRYRKNISEKFTPNFSDAKLNFVPDNGYGSSFDVRSMNHNAQSMKVLSRWKHFAKDIVYKQFFNDYEIINLSLKLWPVLTKEIIKEVELLDKGTIKEVGL
jgi:hypothetical protein